MINSEALRCGECGHRGLVRQDVKNSYQAPWADFPKLRVAVSLKLPVCPQCGNVVIPGDEVAGLNAAMEESARLMVQRLIGEVLATSKIKARELARLLGVTPEYLSTIANGKKRPSFQIAQMLLIFLAHPDIIPELKITGESRNPSRAKPNNTRRMHEINTRTEPISDYYSEYSGQVLRLASQHFF